MTDRTIVSEHTRNRMIRMDMAEVWSDQISIMCRKSADLLETQIRDLKKAPMVTLSGHLIKSKEKGYIRWQRVWNSAESESGKRKVTYLRKSDGTIIHQLAYKIYMNSLILVKEGQLQAADAYLRRVSKIDKYSLRIVHDEDIKKLLGRGDTMKTELERWQNADFQSNPTHPEGLKVHADGKRMVRSKSEAIIVSELTRIGAPFRYECALELPGNTVYPDFTIRHPVSGKIILWEHFGMMDDKTYVANYIRKMDGYIQAGYFPGQNLIVTYETREHPLDYRYVRMLAEYHFEMM